MTILPVIVCPLECRKDYSFSTDLSWTGCSTQWIRTLSGCSTFPIWRDCSRIIQWCWNRSWTLRSMDYRTVVSRVPLVFFFSIHEFFQRKNNRTILFDPRMCPRWKSSSDSFRLSISPTTFPSSTRDFLPFSSPTHFSRLLSLILPLTWRTIPFVTLRTWDSLHPQEISPIWTSFRRYWSTIKWRVRSLMWRPLRLWSRWISWIRIRSKQRVQRSIYNLDNCSSERKMDTCTI